MTKQSPAIALVFAAISLLFTPTLTFAQKPSAELPVYTLGQKWLRSDGDYDLIRIEKDAYIFSAGNGREIHLTKELAPKLVKRAQQVVEFDPPPKFAWPLEVGKWGASDGTWRTPDFPRGEFSGFAWSVDAYEDVRVPAGTFKAFRIALSVTRKSQQPLSSIPGWTGKLWYAPEARLYVKAEGRFEIEMSDFQVISLERPPRDVAISTHPQATQRPGPCYRRVNPDSWQGDGASGRNQGHHHPQRPGDREAGRAADAEKRDRPEHPDQASRGEEYFPRGGDRCLGGHTSGGPDHFL